MRRGGLERLLPADERGGRSGRQAEDPGNVVVLLPVLEAQLGGEIARGLYPLAGVLLQTAPDDAGETGGQVGPRLGHWRWGVAQDRRDQIHR